MVPTGTLPKFTVSGVMASAAFAPVPVRVMYTKLLVALLPSITRPLIVPTVKGVNFTVRVTWAPGDSVRGKLRPLRLYMVPCKLSSLKATLAEPVLVMVTGTLFVAPICTLPKFTAEGKKDRVPAAALALLGVMAARQVRNTQASRLP